MIKENIMKYLKDLIEDIIFFVKESWSYVNKVDFFTKGFIVFMAYRKLVQMERKRRDLCNKK